MKSRIVVLAVVAGRLVCRAGAGRRVQHAAGQTSLQFVTVGDPGNAADTELDGDPTSTVRCLHVPDRQVRRDGRPVLPVPQRRGQDGHLRPVQSRDMARTIRRMAITRAGVRAATPTRSPAASSPVRRPIVRTRVTWGDAARFCNWLQNGQPTGAKGRHDGNRGIHAQRRDTNAALMAVTRNAGAAYSFRRRTSGTRRRITRAAEPTPATGSTRPRATPRRATCFPRPARTTPIYDYNGTATPIRRTI